MIDALTEPISQGITQRALAETVILGVACGPLGVWVIQYRHSYTAESIAHAMLPGLVIASLSGVPLLAGAAAGVLVAAAAIWIAARQRMLGQDAAVAVTVTALFGLGALLALSPDVPARLGEILFGDLLAIDPAELGVTAGISIAVLAGLAVLHRELSLAAFDPATSAVLGARSGAVELALLVLVGIAVVAASRALGNLLAIALLVAPALAAGRICRRLVPSLVLAAAIAAGAGIGGLYLSYYLELAAGASVAATAVSAFVVAAAFGHRPARRAAPDAPVEGLRGTI
jgi:ABC-type Mn2+/Zn2+ transport system permease subunit